MERQRQWQRQRQRETEAQKDIETEKQRQRETDAHDAKWGERRNWKQNKTKQSWIFFQSAKAAFTGKIYYYFHIILFYLSHLAKSRRTNSSISSVKLDTFSSLRSYLNEADADFIADRSWMWWEWEGVRNSIRSRWNWGESVGSISASLSELRI